MRVDVDERLSELVVACAADLALQASANGLTRIIERDHLQPSFSRVARHLAAGWTPPADVSTSLRPRSELWPRLGGIDVALLFPSLDPVAVELKCGSTHDTLAPCAWDALKLAFFSQLGAISAGYLLAATPLSAWRAPLRGAELFETADVDTLALRAGFLDWWRHWERLRDPLPAAVPSRFATRAVTRAPLALMGEPWELRLAAVRCRTDDRIEWLTTFEPPKPDP